LKLQETEADRIQKELMNKIEDLDQQRTTMSTRFNDSEASQSNQLAQMEQKFKEEVAKLEQELEDKHVQCENDIKLIQSRSEESLA
jgi:chromosome segregation ATPase